jgi:ankyrin repeat protein
LLDNGVNIEYRDNDGRTPLSKNACNGEVDEDTVRLLLMQGANNIGQEDNEGLTPLHHIVLSGDQLDEAFDITGLLLEYGANIEHEDHYGRTPLGIACQYATDGLAGLLLEYGANIHHQDTNGRTPLFLALRVHQLPTPFEAGYFILYDCLYLEISRLLLDQGASIEHQDNFGRTPLQFLLEESGQEVNSCHDFVYMLVKEVVQRSSVSLIRQILHSFPEEEQTETE